MDGERMNGTCELARERRIYHAVALDPALPLEGLRHNIHTEVRLAARPVAGVAFMQMRFIRDVEAFRRESFTQLVCDSVLDGLMNVHGRADTSATAFRQCRIENKGFAMSRLEASSIALS